MKIFVAIAVLLLAGLAVVFLVRSSSDGRGSAVAPAAPTADAPTPDVPLAPPTLVPDDKLATPADAEVKRSGIESPASAEARVEIRGQLQPVAGCGDDDRIEVFAFREEMSSSALDWHLDEKRAKPAKAGSSDAIGPIGRALVKPDLTFSIAVPAGTKRAHLIVRGHYVYMLESTPVRLGDAQPAALIAECGAAIAGTVSPPVGFEARAADIEGLEVDVTTSLEGGIGDLTGMGRMNRSAQVKAGRFEVDAVDARTGYDLKVDPPTLAGSSTPVAGLAAGRTRNVDIVMQRGGTLRGIVKGPDGAPLPGATVEAKRKGSFFGFDDKKVRGATAASDGTFELVAVMPGRVLLVAEAPGYLAGNPQPVDVVDGATRTDIVVELGKGQTVVGTVTWSDGKPAADAQVNVEFDKGQMAGMNAFNATRGAEGKAKTDAAGRFEVSGLGAGPFTVKAESLAPEDAVTYAEASSKEKSKHMQRARKDGVKPDAKELELVLAPAQGLRGKVVDATAKPVAEYHIHAVSVGTGILGDFGQDEVEEDVKDEAGAFLISLPREGAWKLMVDAEGFASSTPLEITLPRKELDPPIVITLERAAIVRGIVQDPRGVPVVGATVEIGGGDPSWKKALTAGRTPTAKSGAGGAFELEGLQAGHVALVADSKSSAKSADVGLDLLAGEVREGVVLALREGGRLTGEVYEGGKGAAGMLVQATQLKNYDQASGFTDSQGRFEMKNLEPGSYQVVAMPTSALKAKDDGSGIDQMEIMSKLKMTSAQIEEGKDTHVVLGAAPADPVQVRGHVTLAGQPFSGAMVVFMADGKDVLASMKTAQVGTDGAYALTLDGPGDYSVTVQRMSGKPGEQSSVEFNAKVPAEKEHVLDLVMPGGRISGRVMGAEGGPVEGVRVQVQAQDGVKTGTMFGGQFHLTSTDSDGRYDLQALRAGPYLVSAGGDPFGGALGGDTQHARKTSNVKLGDGDWRKDVDFRLEKPGTVIVTVVDERGEPVAEAAVFARDPDGQLVDSMSMLATEGDGTAKYAGLSAGRHTFSARSKAHTSLESSPVDVEPGVTKSVKLSLVAGTRLLVRVVDKEKKPLQAYLSVVDEAGREVANMVGLAEITEMFSGGSAFSRDETPVGPLAPGKYRVRAVREDGKVVEKPVSLSGQPERKITLQFED